MTAPTYHDLHVTAPGISRTSIFHLPYGLKVTCCRVAGWALWRYPDSGFTGAIDPAPVLLAGEYAHPGKWLVLDVSGHVIVDSRRPLGEDEP